MALLKQVVCDVYGPQCISRRPARLQPQRAKYADDTRKDAGRLGFSRTKDGRDICGICGESIAESRVRLADQVHAAILAGLNIGAKIVRDGATVSQIITAIEPIPEAEDEFMFATRDATEAEIASTKIYGPVLQPAPPPDLTPPPPTT